MAESEIGFARIVRTLLRKKVEKIMDKDISVHSKNQQSHQIAYSLPYSFKNMMFIGSGWHKQTVDVHFNEEYVEPVVACKILNEFSQLLFKHDFDLVLLSNHTGETTFTGTGDRSNSIAQILTELGPLWTHSKGYTMKQTHHSVQFIPELDTDNICVKVLMGNRTIRFINVDQARMWVKSVRLLDTFIDEEINKLKLEFHKKEFYLRVEVSAEAYNQNIYKARLNDKYYRNVKSIDRLFDSLRSKVINL